MPKQLFNVSLFYSKFQSDDSKLSGFIRLIRPNNLLFIVILLGVMEKWVAEPILLKYNVPAAIGADTLLTWWQLLLLIAATVLIAAGGYVINDYFDVKIDAINRPDKLIITRSVSKQEAMLYFQVLTGIGIACGLASAFVLKSVALATVFVLTPGILWFYSASYKRQFLVGNLTISFLSALTPLIIAFANDAALKTIFGESSELIYLYLCQHLYMWIGGFALFSFLCTWIRETLKDMQDQQGDREMECHTFPIKFGELATKIFLTLLILGTCAVLSYFNFSLLPTPFAWGNFASRFYLLLMIAFACELWLLWAAKITSDYQHAQLLMKFIMFIGTMFAFCVPNFFAPGI